MVKYSRQRECILNNLKSRRDHPTADMVYESVREEQPNISLGTVYRNLSFLVDRGEIRKISTGTGPDHFDGCASPHIHFICKKCDGISDMEDISGLNVIEKVHSQFKGIVDEYELKIFGTCEECLSK